MSAAIRITRRSLIAAIGMTAAGGATAFARSGAYSGVSVDVSNLRRLGLGPYAEFVRAQMTRAMQASFTGRIGTRGAPGLVVRVTNVTLSGFAGLGSGGSNRFGTGQGSEANDYIEGEALVVNGSNVIQRYPQLATLPSSSGGPTYLPNNEQKRTIALCDAYAQWLARAL